MLSGFNLKARRVRQRRRHERLRSFLAGLQVQNVSFVVKPENFFVVHIIAKLVVGLDCGRMASNDVEHGHYGAPTMRLRKISFKSSGRARRLSMVALSFGPTKNSGGRRALCCITANQIRPVTREVAIDRAAARLCYVSPMRPHDQQRFAKMISDFVEGAGFEKPFHLVVIDSRGTASVTRYGHLGVEQVRSGPSRPNRLRMIPPLVVTVISSDGVGRSAKITVEAARVTMQ